MKTNKDLLQEYADSVYPIVGDYDTHRYGNDRMNEYIIKSTIQAIRLPDNSICYFDKPSIETHFCFADEGDEYEYYRELNSEEEKMKRYFFAKNLNHYNEVISLLEKDEDDHYNYAGFNYYNDKCCSVGFLPYSMISDEGFIEEGLAKHERSPNWRPMTMEERKLCLETYRELKAAFEKRLNTWWKRYGVEKLHTWTYWRDR